MSEKLTLFTNIEMEKNSGAILPLPCVHIANAGKKHSRSRALRFNKAALNMIGYHSTCMVYGITDPESSQDKVIGLAFWFSDASRSDRKNGIYHVFEDASGFRITVTGLATVIDLKGKFDALEAKALLVQEPIQNDDKMLYKVMFEKVL